MTPRLAGKVIVIVGGTSGLGLSAAHACLREGARVVAVGRDREKAEAAASELGAEALVLVGDATDSAVAGRAVHKALERFGHFNGLYHVAGGSGRRRGDGPLDQITDDGWSYTLQENLNSVFLSNRAAVQQFLKQGGGGTIVNLSSVLGFSPSPKFFATHAYATSKAATIGLSQAAAAYYAKENIRVNVLAPGLVATPMSARAQADAEIQQFVATKQPLDGGRIGQSSDLDSAAVYLLSDESKFVTGQVLAVDGGWCVSEGQW